MKKRKILIVDDSPGFTKVVRLAIEAEANYEVREQNDSQMAVETARKFQPDLILLDVIMPRMDGGGVLSLIRADSLLRGIPVVFLTATVLKKEVYEHNGTIGGEFFIAKPVGARELIECIEEHVGA